MRHARKGRHLGRTPSHRRCMFRNMAASMILSVDMPEDAPNKPKVPGRIITTVEKAKELRPEIEKMITMAKKARKAMAEAKAFETTAERNSDAWKAWRKSEQWQQWAKAIAPAVVMRRRAYAGLRDKDAVRILFDLLADRFADREGGYTRIVRLAEYRLGDAGRKAMFEFVGENDRQKKSRDRKRQAPVVVPAAN